jgi:hypothetical protein
MLMVLQIEVRKISSLSERNRKLAVWWRKLFVVCDISIVIVDWEDVFPRIMRFIKDKRANFVIIIIPITRPGMERCQIEEPMMAAATPSNPCK